MTVPRYLAQRYELSVGQATLIRLRGESIHLMALSENTA